MPRKQKIKIVILAAGRGTRMKSDEPKALAKLKGKPFLGHVLDNIKKFDPGLRPVIVVGFKKERIKKVFGSKHIYAEQKEQLGTGHAVMSARKAVGEEDGAILVISTDQPLISPKTIGGLIATHLAKKPVMTIATVVVPNFEDWRAGLNHFGRIIRKGKGSVRKIVEFKDANHKEKMTKELNLALYVFDAKWLWNNINKLGNKNSQNEYYLTDLIQIAFDQGKKIEAVQVSNIIEALHPNSKEELAILEKLAP